MEDGAEKGCECELLTSGLVGAVAFPSLLAVTQTHFFKPLRVSLGPGISTPLLGLASVTFASFGASLVALKTLTIVNQYFSPSDVRLSLNRNDLLLSTVSGVVVFRALGGRFSAMLPSNLMRPGAFAAEWVPALRESEAASPKEREVIKMLGQRHGCHSCGEKRGVEFVADHQPPSRLLGNHRNGNSRPVKPNPLLQRFYPQCMHCSRIQGGILGGGNGRALTHSKAIRTHATNFRQYHVFLPLPFAIAYLNETNRRQPMHTIPPDLERTQGTAEETAPQTRAAASTTEAAPEQARQKPTPATEQTIVKEKPAELPATGDSSVWMDVEVALNFPFFILWRKLVQFLDSFNNPLASFHMTVWAFTIIAALGSA